MSNSFGVVLEDMCHLCAGLLQVFDGLVQSAACPLSEFTSLLGMGRRQAMERCAVSIFYCHSESSESLLMSVAKFCHSVRIMTMLAPETSFKWNPRVAWGTPAQVHARVPEDVGSTLAQ